MLRSPTDGNCETDVDEFVLTVASIAKCHKDGGSRRTADADLQISDQYEIAPTCQTLPEKNCIVYVAGYMCRKLLAKHDCEECRKLLTVDRPLHSDQGHTFLCAKAYDHIPDGAGLVTPSECTVAFLNQCEATFMSCFDDVMYMGNVGQRISRIVEAKTVTKLPVGSNCDFVVRLMIRGYVRMRIHYAVKYLNRELSNRPRQKRSRKYLKLSHL